MEQRRKKDKIIDGMLMEVHRKPEVEDGDEQSREQTSTAATLEGFVAMKTKSIHNSVKQWADTAKLGVKSLIGWIRTGGKNNREIIERAEDRQRQRFKNEQYKKPRKKKKGRDSTVYSTMKQQSLCLSPCHYLFDIVE